jgi:hypothetical protein
MAYTLRNDPGILTPYADDNSNNRRVVSRIIETKNIPETVLDLTAETKESQTIEILNINKLASGIITSVDTEEITSATVHFPNTQRARKQDEPYDLEKEFYSASGRQYTSDAAKSLKVYTRSTPSALADPLNTVIAKNDTGATVFTANTNIPFLAAPGKKMIDDVVSISLTSPDASSYQYIEIENADVTIGSTIDKKFSISIWFYLNNKKETILLTKGTTTSQEYELKINSDMKIEFKTFDVYGLTYIITSNLSVEANKWQHVVLSSMGNDWSSLTALTNNFYKLYINKTIDKNYSIDCSTYAVAGTIVPASPDHIFIGSNKAGTIDNNFDGLIAEVAIWQDYYLKKKEVIAMYDSATKSLIKMDTTEIDTFRQGVNVTTDKYKNASLLYKLSSNNQRNIGRPDHYVEQREFGQPANYEGNIPFKDIEGRHTPYNLNTTMILSTETVQYPVVYDNNILEPIRNNGTLEPLAIRETILNNSADSPWQAHRISGEICGGNSNPEFGTIFITNDIKRIEDQQKLGNIMINDDCYFDASEQAFEPVANTAFIDENDDAYLNTIEKITFPVPGFSSDVPQTEVLFDDTIDITTNELITETETISSLSSALPDSSRSNYLIKSANSGFIYGNNPEGTDSLAFGGLLRK